MEDWSEFGFRKDYKQEERVVKQEKIEYCGKGFYVSTIDLGLDHSFGGTTPLYFETMIFATENGQVNYPDLYCDRYETRDEAAIGHAAVITTFKNKAFMFKNGQLTVVGDGEGGVYAD